MPCNIQGKDKMGWSAEYRTGVCVLIAICFILLIIIMIILGRKWIAEKEKERGAYVVRMSPVITGIAVAGALLFLVPSLVFFALSTLDLRGLLIFLIIVLAYMAGCFISLFWVIVVNENKGILTYYQPPLGSRRVSVLRITKVQFLYTDLKNEDKYKIKVYQHSKKMFEVDYTMLGFDQLKTYLEGLEASGEQRFCGCDRKFGGRLQIERGYLKPGKVEKAEYKDDFTVTKSGQDKLGAAIWAVLWLWAVVYFICYWEESTRDEPYAVYYFAGILLLAAEAVAALIFQARYRIRVCDHKIYVRNGFGRERTYAVWQISRAERKEHFITLYTGTKKVAKIEKAYDNFASFEKWLDRELGDSKIFVE